MCPLKMLWELFVPTTIVAYKYGSKANDELITGAKVLLDFYSLIAAVLPLILVFETHLGMFEGLSIAQAWLKATGMD